MYSRGMKVNGSYVLKMSRCNGALCVIICVGSLTSGVMSRVNNRSVMTTVEAGFGVVSVMLDVLITYAT